MEQRYSYSAMQTLLDCEREYALRYMEGLEADKPERILYLRGTAFHCVVAADLLSRGAAMGSLRNFPASLKLTGDTNLEIEWVKYTDGWLERWQPCCQQPGGGVRIALTAYAVLIHLDYWENQQGQERRDEIIADLGETLAQRIANTWDRYSTHWEDRMARERPLLVEFEWARPAPNGMRLQGRVDAVVYDPQDALTIVRDTKTHDSWPSEPDAVLDLMNSQLHLQAWGIAPDLRELTAGDNPHTGPMVPQAVEFDRIRIKKPTTPKLTTKGVLSKSVTDFDGLTYVQFCESAEATEAGYEFNQVEFERACTTEWFRRSMKPLSMRAVAAHVKSMQRQALRASQLVADDAAIQPQKACAWCPFLSLCRAEIIGGRPENFIPLDYGLRRIRV